MRAFLHDVLLAPLECGPSYISWLPPQSLSSTWKTVGSVTPVDKARSAVLIKAWRQRRSSEGSMVGSPVGYPIPRVETIRGAPS